MLSFILGYASATLVSANAPAIARASTALAVHAMAAARSIGPLAAQVVVGAMEDWEDIVAEARASLKAESLARKT